MSVHPSTHTLYLAGPMRGYPAFNFAAFDRSRLELRRRGFAVICPAELDREAGFDPDVDEWSDELGREVARRDLKAILAVDAIAVLRGFTGSAGARVELTAARWLGLPVVAASDPLVDLTAGVDAWLAGDGIALEVDAYERNLTGPVIIERPGEAQREFNYHTGGVIDRNAAIRVGEALNLVGLSAELEAETPRRALLEEAADLVDGDRNAQYGDPRQDFERTAAIWSALLGVEVTTPMVAACMAGLKLSRLVWSPAKRDTWVDLAGYAACGWDCARPDEVDE